MSDKDKKEEPIEAERLDLDEDKESRLNNVPWGALIMGVMLILVLAVAIDSHNREAMEKCLGKYSLDVCRTVLQ